MHFKIFIVFLNNFLHSFLQCIFIICSATQQMLVVVDKRLSRFKKSANLIRATLFNWNNRLHVHNTMNILVD